MSGCCVTWLALPMWMARSAAAGSATTRMALCSSWPGACCYRSTGQSMFQVSAVPGSRLAQPGSRTHAHASQLHRNKPCHYLLGWSCLPPWTQSVSPFGLAMHAGAFLFCRARPANGEGCHRQRRLWLPTLWSIGQRANAGGLQGWQAVWLGDREVVFEGCDAACLCTQGSRVAQSCMAHGLRAPSASSVHDLRFQLVSFEDAPQYLPLSLCCCLHLVKCDGILQSDVPPVSACKSCFWEYSAAFSP